MRGILIQGMRIGSMFAAEVDGKYQAYILRSKDSFEQEYLATKVLNFEPYTWYGQGRCRF